jgi:hypothetical protein
MVLAGRISLSPGLGQTRLGLSEKPRFALAPMPDESAEAILLPMKQVLVVFHLRDGSQEEAARLASADLPFDPLDAGFKRLGVYVTEREAIFVLEGDDPEWREDEIINDFLHPLLGRREARRMASGGRRADLAFTPDLLLGSPDRD